MLRWAGANEVHFRGSSPPTSYPCHLGIDTPTREELIAAYSSVEEIREAIGADSLMYLTLDDLVEIVSGDEKYCMGCFSGEYPMEIIDSEC
jgi:amidophosphoribosyltransferase